MDRLRSSCAGSLALQIGYRAVRQEHIRQRDALFRLAHGAAAQVENQLLRALLLQIGDIGRATSFTLAGVNAVGADVTDLVREHALSHRRIRDHGAHQFHCLRLHAAPAHHRNLHRRAGFALQQHIAYASGISRVPMPLTLSIMSSVPSPALAAGEFGTTPTTPR